jgi:hypothetical protein
VLARSRAQWDAPLGLSYGSYPLSDRMEPQTLGEGSLFTEQDDPNRVASNLFH